MAAPTWMPVSPTLSVVSDLSLGSNSSVSGNSVFSSASTQGTAKYVAPGLRKDRAKTKYELEIATLKNDLAEARTKAAKHQGDKLPSFDLPYCLNKSQLNFITSRFPRTTFRCSSDVMHDHPLAHTETMIATAKAMRLIPAGHRIIDLFGSPSKSKDFNKSQARSNNPKSMVAYCATMTEKDYVRALRWGPERDAQGNTVYVRSHTGDVIADLDPHRGGVDPCFGVTRTSELTYFCRNTLYYLSDYQIASLLRPTGSRMLALVHRHAGSSGNMFDGEMSFGKIAGAVEQVNKLTGERYVHRDLSWLWDSTTKVVHTEAGSFVWTFHMVSPETWIIELTGCPASLDERVMKRSRDVGTRQAAAEHFDMSVTPTRFPHPGLQTLPSTVVTMVGGVPVVRFGSDVLPPVRLTCPELFEYLKLSQAGKPRDGERLMDLFSLARSHVANGSEFPGKKNFRVSAEDLPGHVVLAFLAGLSVETEFLASIETFKVTVKKHSALLASDSVLVNSDSQVVGNTALSLLRRANKARVQSDVVTGLLTALE